MKQYFQILCVCAMLLGLGAHTYAQIPGSTCSQAIVLTPDFSDTITRVGVEKWYSAMTFDLPLSVAFVPTDGESAPAPEVEMDFSCISGYYEDSILCSLFCRTSGSGGLDIKMPYKQALTRGQKDGHFAYTLSLGKRYRDLLLQMGISSNLTVYVKVKYTCTGILTMEPDAFNNCMDGPKFIHIGDTVNVAAKDSDRHVIIPYAQWQEDTIIYSWDGASPCQLTVANTCDFSPFTATSDVIQFEQVPAGGSLKTYANHIYEWVHDDEFPNQAGMYFAKFYSESPGEMKITKARQAPPAGDAIMLRYDRIYALNANETQIFAIPRSWDKNVKFSTPTAHLFTMQISKTAQFDEADILKTYPFERTVTGRWTGVTASDLSSFWNQIPLSQHYLYIRFICTEATTVMPELWAVSECYTKTKSNVIAPGDSKTITKGSQHQTPTTIYRLAYADWVGGDMEIKFSLSDPCEIYIADTCGMNINKADAPYWLKYAGETSSDESLIIPAAEIASWADRIDGEGCFYVCFYSGARSGTRRITLTTNAPEEKDPVYPATSVSVVCDDEGNKYVRVKENQPIVILQGTDVKMSFDAVAGEPHSLSGLPAGTYTLRGQNDEIVLKL